MHEYRELRIRITRDDAGFRTFAEGPTGEASGTLEQPFTDFELGSLIGKVGRPRQDVRSGTRPDLDLVRRFGADLFEALFRNQIRDLYQASLAATRAQGNRLRVTLALTDAPGLMRIPWEFLYDESRQKHLAIWGDTSVVRYLDLEGVREPVEIEPPLRILAMVSGPDDPQLAPLDAGGERQKVEAALAPLQEIDAVKLTWLTHATRQELQACLWEDSYHVFHYIGHGGFDEQEMQGMLYFETDDGQRDEVGPERLATLLDHSSLRLAVLNSCEGARTAVDDPFTGVASGLVQNQIPAVVAMQFEITDRAAILFSWGLYGALAAGHPIDAALTEARRAIHNDDNELEWGTPVLFMRVHDGRIFDISKPAVESVPMPALPRAKRSLWPRVKPRLRAGAVVAAIVAAAALAYVLLDDGRADAWARSSVDASVLGGDGRQAILGITMVPGDRAVAVGTSNAAPAVWAYDGARWSRRRLAGDRGSMRDIVAGGGTLVAVGDDGRLDGERDARIWTRSGGGTWQSVCGACGGPGAQAAYGIVWRARGSFVAVGRDTGVDDSYDAAVWVSSDGSNWGRAALADPDLAGPNSQVMNGVIDMNGRLVAVGRDGKDAAVWTSADGFEWTRQKDLDLRALGGFLELNAVTWLGRRRVLAVGRDQAAGANSGAAWISFDRGSTWSRGRGDFDELGQQLRSVARDGRKLIAVGWDDTGTTGAVWRSIDGETWTAVESESFSGDGVVMSGVVRLDDGTLLVVGEDGDDAAIWESRAPGETVAG